MALRMLPRFSRLANGCSGGAWPSSEAALNILAAESQARIHDCRLAATGAQLAAYDQRHEYSCSAASRDPQGESLAETQAPLQDLTQNPHDNNGFGKKLRHPQPQNVPQDPWTPTHQLKKWKFLPRRMGFMLQELEKEHELKLKAQRKHPDFESGCVLELKLAVPENKSKPSIFKGLVIAKQNKGIRSSFTIRNHLGTVGAVERTFPLYSPTIQSIKVLEQRKYRRAKLYYLRGRNPKEYRV